MQPSNSSGLEYKQQVMSPPPGRFRWRRLRFSQRIVSCAMLMGLAGIVAAILFPVFAQPHSRDHHSSCQSNVKQIGLGLLMYAQDYDETFPCGARSNRQNSQIVKDTPRQAKYHVGQAWAGGVYPYVKNVMTFLCPDVERQMRQNVQPPYEATPPYKAIGYGTSQTLLLPISYFYNRNVALDTKSSTFAAPADTVMLGEVAGGSANIREADERNPENTYSSAGNGLTILASTDGANETQASGGLRYATGALGGYGREAGCPLWPFYAPQSTPRHGGSSAESKGSVYVMADGHVKFFKPEQVSPGDDAASSKEAQDCAHHRAAGTAQRKDFAVTFSVR